MKMELDSDGGREVRTAVDITGLVYHGTKVGAAVLSRKI